MKRFFSILLAGLMLFAVCCSAASAETALYGLAIDKLATRDGPGTTYKGMGTYSVSGQYIRVLSRAWDDRNKIWWVKCEIPYHGEIRVLWTGYKRFDPNTLPLESIPIEGSGSAEPYPSGQEWQAAYKQFISSGQYDLYILNPDDEYNRMLAERDRQWDSFILHDIDGNNVPELIVWSTYGIEQADVFTWNKGIFWLGRIGGDNFFQGFFSYAQYPQAGLITLEGGPAMKIRAFKYSNMQTQEQTVGMTTVDSEGMETTGITMYINDGTLFQLLYGTLIQGDWSALLDNWCTLYSLQNENRWELLFR